MQVTVHYFAQLRRAAGVASETVDIVPGATLAQLVVLLSQRHGESFHAMALDPVGAPQRALVYAVGDEQADLSRILHDGDVITILAPMAGGSLTPDERARYEWQLWTDGFGEAGQAKLKNATVLVSRIGGVGGTVAYHLAAAGVGKLILAHAGNLRVDDLNRQLLMRHDGVDQPRVEQAARRLREFNPHVAVETVPENVNEANVDALVGRADAVASCAPLFAERLLMNRAAVRQGKPLVDCAMYELEVQLFAVVPGRTPCLACLYPTAPPAWQRRFPVFGAVAGTAGSLGAMEVIKVLTGLGEPPSGRMLIGDLRTLAFRTVQIHRNPKCAICGTSEAILSNVIT